MLSFKFRETTTPTKVPMMRILLYSGSLIERDRGMEEEQGTERGMEGEQGTERGSERRYAVDE